MKNLARLAIASLLLMSAPAFAQDSTGVPEGDVGYTAPVDPLTGFTMTDDKICRGANGGTSIICDKDMPTFSGDNLGTHSATMAINAAAHGINNAGPISGATTINATGTIFTTGNLNVGGTAWATSYLHNSDASLKDNIQTIQDPFALLEAINGSTYTWKSTGALAYGVIAQDVEKTMPGAVQMKDDGTKAVEYDALLAPVIEAIKLLKAENDNLRSDIEALQAAQN